MTTDSSSSIADDIWDDDFATSIIPSALDLSHLKPHDYFAGKLSYDNMKTITAQDTETNNATRCAFITFIRPSSSVVKKHCLLTSQSREL